jgi:hypothetical protein
LVPLRHAQEAAELELELLQTQMAQKPMLRAEVYVHARSRPSSCNQGKDVRIDMNLLGCDRKWLVGCGAAAGGVFRIFDDGFSIAVLYYFRGRLRFARSA